MASQSTMLYVDAPDLMLKKAVVGNQNKFCFRPTDVKHKKLQFERPQHTYGDVVLLLFVI